MNQSLAPFLGQLGGGLTNAAAMSGANNLTGAAPSVAGLPFSPINILGITPVVLVSNLNEQVSFGFFKNKIMQIFPTKNFFTKTKQTSKNWITLYLVCLFIFSSILSLTLLFFYQSYFQSWLSQVFTFF